jgi:hypothetical protein
MLIEGGSASLDFFPSTQAKWTFLACALETTKQKHNEGQWPGKSCILDFEGEEKVWIGHNDYLLGICSMTRKRHQQSFLIGREHGKIKQQEITFARNPECGPNHGNR